MKGTIGFSGTLSLPFAIVICAPPDGGWALGCVMNISGEFEAARLGAAELDSRYCRVFGAGIEVQHRGGWFRCAAIAA
jgi:hypothetical protein